ncbi:MAG: phosphopantetheine-binding protein [Candidatus Aphodousia sp.]|nr:phosphopantetheine-binding protein [Sutterella sp.]MDY2899767.1 phosphopantetheine-binding protein [Candidatus Aphodousia sp.]
MDSLKQDLKILIIETLDLEDATPEDITDDLPLFAEDGLGLDSVDGLELGLALKKRYGVQLSADQTNTQKYFQNINTLTDCVNDLGTK